MDEAPLSPSAQQALEAFRAQTSGALAPARRGTIWRAAVAGTRPAGNRLVLKALVLCVSSVVGAVAVTGLLRTAEPEVQPSPSALWRREADDVTVQRGQLRVAPQKSRVLAVVTPQLQAHLQNAAALFDVSQTATLLSVESGEVTWRARGKSGVLGAGQRMTVNTAAPALQVPGAPAVDSCGAGEGYAQCLAGAARGSGLAAETALYALGMLAHEQGDLAEAARQFQVYAERFPDGVFGPEASIARMVDLRQQGNAAQASSEAARFAARFGSDPRAADVARWAEELR